MVSNSYDFGLLRKNLSEIYYSLHHIRTGAMPLTDWNGSLYYTGSLLGKLIRWLFGKPAADTINHTINTLFHKCVVNGYTTHQKRLCDWVNRIGKAANPDAPITEEERITQECRYKTSVETSLGSGNTEIISPLCAVFRESLQNDPLNDASISNTRHVVSECTSATREFWKHATTNQGKVLLAPLNLQDDQILHNRTFYKALKVAQSIPDLEALLEMDIPIVALAKLSKPDEMTSYETRSLDEWIEKLNLLKDKIPLKLFENVLTEAFRAIEIEGHYSMNYEDLLVKLEERGCSLLQMKDRNHLRWREGLRPGDIIWCNEEQLTLGAEIGNKLDHNAYRVFTVVEQPEHVVRIAINRFRLRIESKLFEKENQHWGIQPAAIQLDGEGKCALVEKLEMLPDIAWSSNEKRISEHDWQKAWMIALHLYYMVDARVMPENLSSHLQHLGFDADGILKSLSPLKKTSFDYTELETFCRQIHPSVASFLTVTSGLSQHWVAEFYRNAVKHTLSTGETNILSRRQNRTERSAAYENHLEALCAQAKQIRSQCIEKVDIRLMRNRSTQFQRAEDLERAVSDMLANYYNSSLTPGSLEGLEESVIEHFQMQKPPPPTHQQLTANFQAYHTLLKANLLEHVRTSE